MRGLLSADSIKPVNWRCSVIDKGSSRDNESCFSFLFTKDKTDFVFSLSHSANIETRVY